MPRPIHPLPAIVDDVAGEALALASQLHTAHAFQWDAPPMGRFDSPVPALSGLRNDPTGHAAVDPRRLALRAAVVESELALEAAVTTMRTTRATLAEALRRWQGEPLAQHAA